MNHEYARGKLGRLLRDLDCYTDGEFRREMARTISGSTGQDISDDCHLQAAQIAERDNAWQELREIRNDIGANQEESTADEVRRVIAERDSALAQNAELVARNLEKLNNCLDALQIANKRIEKLEKYNLDLANESHNKSNMIDYERSKNAESARNGFIAGYHKMHIDFVGSLAPDGSAEHAATQYAEKVRRGEV